MQRPVAMTVTRRELFSAVFGSRRCTGPPPSRRRLARSASHSLIALRALAIGARRVPLVIQAGRPAMLMEVDALKVVKLGGRALNQVEPRVVVCSQMSRQAAREVRRLPDVADTPISE